LGEGFGQDRGQGRFFLLSSAVTHWKGLIRKNKRKQKKANLFSLIFFYLRLLTFSASVRPALNCGVAWYRFALAER
jgi:uncharacterized membrane protein